MTYPSNKFIPPWLIKLFILAFIVAGTLMIYGYYFPSSNNIIESPPVMALLNPKLFKKDFYIQDTLQITPRYYYQYFIYLLANSGLGIVGAYFFCYLLAFTSFTAGLFAIGKQIGKSHLSAIALVFLGLFTSDGTVGYVSLFREEPIPAVLAMGLTIWGVYFSFCNRWLIGYLFFGLAILIQFLVGLLPALLMTPILVIEGWKNRNLVKVIFPLLILGLLASLVFLPMVASGNTNSSLIGNREFIYLYGYLRQPHHIILTAFATREWRNFFCFSTAGILLIRNSDFLRSPERRKFFIVISFSFLLLLLSYIFIEVFPVALIAKLQFARTTPFVKLIILMALSVLIVEHYQQRNFAICILLLVIPVVRNGAILLLCLAIALTILKAINRRDLLRDRITTWLGIVIALLLLTIYPSPASASIMVQRLAEKLFCLLILTLPFIIKRFWGLSYKTLLTISTLAVITWLLLLLSLFNFLPQNLASLVKKRIAINNLKNDELTQLSLRFRQKTPEDALILTPPSQTRFRYYSQRSLVYTFYTSPYTDRGLREWANRLQAIAGTLDPPLSWRNIDSYYRKRSSSELIQLAQKYGANYVLTRFNWHPDFHHQVFDRQGPWVIYSVRE